MPDSVTGIYLIEPTFSAAALPIFNFKRPTPIEVPSGPVLPIPPTEIVPVALVQKKMG